MPKLSWSRCGAPAALLASMMVASLCGAAVVAEKAKAAVVKKRGTKPLLKPVAPLPDATAEQLAAADLVYTGHYDCEFKQTVDIKLHAARLGYVDVQFGKVAYVMKPVLSSTGAIRLEDVRAETLMVQIGAKSMLLNIKTGHRLVDDCVSPQQREWVEAANQAKLAETAALAAEQQAQSAACAASTACVVAAPASAAAPAASAATPEGQGVPAPPEPTPPATPIEPVPPSPP